MRKKTHTTFAKLTLSFVVFGLLPIMAIMIWGYFKYTDIAKNTMISNYTQIDAFFAKNVETVISDVDQALSGMYDYSISEPNKMLQLIGERSVYISGVRYVDQDGNLYYFYKNQEKVLKKDGGVHTSMGLFIEASNPRDCIILGATEESNICINSDEFIFTIARNYMDLSSVASASSNALATILADINVESLDEIVEGIGLTNGECYVYDMNTSRYLYSKDPSMYLDGANPLIDVQEEFVGESGYVKNHGIWYFYNAIPNTSVYAVVTSDSHTGMVSATERVIMLVIFIAVAILLISLTIWFSKRMSDPPRKLKRAMESVTAGDLSTRVEVNTNDEMQYIADGFNNMVERLSEYIDQVYVSEIYRKDAELNALKMQIKPHYLYNTLDVIRMVALDESAEKSAQLLECLAHQLRYVMGDHSEKITLKEEIEVIREYFIIMQVRYEDRINLLVQMKEKDENLLIPKMILQPVVENAIRHGLRDKEGLGAVSIQVKSTDDELEIIIMDDGVGMDEQTRQELIKKIEEEQQITDVNAKHTGIGMKNVYERIKLGCGKQYGFTIDSVEGMGTIVTYHLPVEKE